MPKLTTREGGAYRASDRKSSSAGRITAMATVDIRESARILRSAAFTQ